jgi:DNA-binding transcriptional MerR regulator
MKMRELEQRTGINREVIRILIREGLVPQPDRPARNAAEYDERHVAAIGAIRQIRQTSRLTLKEIRGAMEGQGLPSAGPVAAYRQLEELLAIRFDMREPKMIPLGSLERRFPKARRDAKAFEAMGMLTISSSAEGEMISLADARLVEIWGEIRDVGFVEETGFPPENIAFYREAAELVAQNEAKLFIEMSEGRIADDQAATMLHRALPLMLDFFGLLRIKAFMKNIHVSAD